MTEPDEATAVREDGLEEDEEKSFLERISFQSPVESCGLGMKHSNPRTAKAQFCVPDTDGQEGCPPPGSANLW